MEKRNKIFDPDKGHGVQMAKIIGVLVILDIIIILILANINRV